MSDQNIGKSNEFICVELDELGWEVVYKDGTFYHKKTIVHDNGLTRIYNPIPFKKKEK